MRKRLLVADFLLTFLKWSRNWMLCAALNLNNIYRTGAKPLQQAYSVKLVFTTTWHDSPTNNFEVIWYSCAVSRWEIHRCCPSCLVGWRRRNMHCSLLYLLLFIVLIIIIISRDGALPKPKTAQAQSRPEITTTQFSLFHPHLKQTPYHDIIINININININQW